MMGYAIFSCFGYLWNMFSIWSAINRWLAPMAWGSQKSGTPKPWGCHEIWRNKMISLWTHYSFHGINDLNGNFAMSLYMYVYQRLTSLCVWTGLPKAFSKRHPMARSHRSACCRGKRLMQRGQWHSWRLIPLKMLAMDLPDLPSG